MGTYNNGNKNTEGGQSPAYNQAKSSTPKLTKSAIEHSNIGEFQKNGRMKSGGHGQDNIEKLEEEGIEYNIVKEYSNGVRVGNIPGHSEKYKRSGDKQAWFPKDWTEADIKAAGRELANTEEARNAKGNATIKGTYKGVNVGIIVENGKIKTIFPDYNQPE